MPHFTAAKNAAESLAHLPALKVFSRHQLESYMIDCHGFDAAELAEWETVDDLRADIRSFGWERECCEYLA